MDTNPGLPSRAATEQETWEVFRDAFALPQDTRRPKPWDRSSVTAHAPRLQGRKIWKKAGIQVRKNDENADALLELQSEGNGSRKKHKVHAAKENIRDALWKGTAPALEPVIHDIDNGSVSAVDNVMMGEHGNGEGDELRFVPRKRTNADRVITPRKPLQQTLLNSQAQTLQTAPSEVVDDIPTRKKKPLRRSSIRKSTSARSSARFSSGFGPSWLPDEHSTIVMPIQQPPDAASLLAFKTGVSTIDSHPADNNLEFRDPPMADDGSDGANTGTDSQGAWAIREVEGPKARKRSRISRDSELCSRTSASLTSISEDTPPQPDRAAENTGDALVSNHELRHSSVAAATSGVQGTEEAPKPSVPFVVRQAFEPGLSNDDQIQCHQLERRTQGSPITVLSSNQIDTPPQVNRDSSPGSPSDQLHREVSQGQDQTALPTSMELSSNCSTRPFVEALEIRKTCEDDTQPPDDTSTLDSITVAADPSQLPLPGPANTPPVQPAVEHTSTGYEDDTDMLRKFLTRVKANKAAKAEGTIPQRKRSLPHSPLRLPLGDIDANASPSPLSLKPKEEPAASLPSPSPKRRRRHGSAQGGEEDGGPKTIRRSGRTRLPVKTTPGAPSLIPVRRLGADGDSTVTIRRSEEKDLAALTRVNTRKNKGLMGPTEVLLLKAAEKTDPVLKQRLLKEMFEEKQNKGKKSEKPKSVAWAKELAQFQCEKREMIEKATRGSVPITAKKTNAVRAGLATNKIALSRGVNGTPATKRRARERP